MEYENAMKFAARSGLTYGHILYLCHEGLLPYLKHGTKYIIPVEMALEELTKLAAPKAKENISAEEKKQQTISRNRTRIRVLKSAVNKSFTDQLKELMK